jgi:hypothetical protein
MERKIRILFVILGKKNPAVAWNTLKSDRVKSPKNL